LIETVVLVPERDNDGKLISVRSWRGLERRLLRFGGLSRMDGVDGIWQSGTRLYQDRSRQYTVALDSWWSLPAWLRIVDWACTAFAQEALYVKVAGVPEIRNRRAP
jgi:hypothetical protein